MVPDLSDSQMKVTSECPALTRLNTRINTSTKYFLLVSTMALPSSLLARINTHKFSYLFQFFKVVTRQ
jgi:hypothetical protein